MPVNRFHKIACPTLVDVVILGITAGLGAASAMDDVGYAFQGFCQGSRFQDRAGSSFRCCKVPTDKASIAGRPNQIGRGDTLGVECVQDMTADKACGACDQNFQSGQAEFLANFAQFIEGKIDLRVCVGCHQADSN